MTDTILHVLQTMQDQLNRMEAAMIPRPEYEAFKVHVESALRDVTAHKDAAHTRLDRELEAHAKAIEAVDARMDAHERDRSNWARDVNLKVWLAILAAGLSVVVGVAVGAFG